MKRIIDTSDILGILETAEGTREVCVSAEPSYDENSAQLIVKLDGFLRNTDLLSKEKRFVADWIPKPEIIRESVGQDETVEMARDIFHRWVRKVKDAAPSLTSH